MVDIGTTTMSSKGQIVIPARLREDMKEGDKFVLLRKGKLLLLQKASDVEEKFAEDLIVADRVAKAWKEVDQGKTKRFASWEEFKKELDSLKAPAPNVHKSSSKRTKK